MVISMVISSNPNKKQQVKRAEKLCVIVFLGHQFVHVCCTGPCDLIQQIFSEATGIFPASREEFAGSGKSSAQLQIFPPLTVNAERFW